MKATILNIVSQAVKPSRFRVMAGKIASRIQENKDENTRQENLHWIKDNTESYESYALSVDAQLWSEAKTIGIEISNRAHNVLKDIEYDLGGGGVYTFLYFIARYIKPKVVVETGVAAGFSSYSFLEALKQNKVGKLYSSDFPYFRLPNPEKFIGIIVPDGLRDDWSLMIEGDEKNLPKIVSQVGEINLFHYDSDKSYVGRKKALATLSDKFGENVIILMDDIQDNAHFRDFVKNISREKWRIFEFEGKYVGMIGNID